MERFKSGRKTVAKIYAKKTGFVVETATSIEKVENREAAIMYCNWYLENIYTITF